MADSKREWLEKIYNPAIDRAKARKPEFKTTSDTVLQPVYAPEDTPELDYQAALGYPGEYPYTPRRPAHHVSRPLLDHAPVRRLLLRRGVQQALPLPAWARPDRPLRCL